MENEKQNGKDSSFHPEINKKIFPLIKKLNQISDDDFEFFEEVLKRLG